jgi:hypothetical protein
MIAPATLPRLELGETTSPFDEAVILIDGHEEETITIECDGAGALAERLVGIVNSHEALLKALEAAMHALRSYEFGNFSSEPAQSTADRCEAILAKAGAAA